MHVTHRYRRVMEKRIFFILTVLVVLSTKSVNSQSQAQVKNLLTDLFTNSTYNKVIRPVADQGDKLLLEVDFFLSGINYLDEVSEKMSVIGYLQVAWKDFSLTWDPANYGGLEDLYVPQNMIWRPDLTLTNGLLSVKDLGSDFVLVIVDKTGRVEWKPNAVIETKCPMDIRKFPFDIQKCDIVFGNWVSPNELVDVEVGDAAISLSSYNANGEWNIVGTRAKSVDSTHSAVAQFTFILERKSSYHVIAIIVPVSFLSLIVNFTFMLPVDCGEKMSFCVTVYLAFAVFLTIVSGLLPASSGSVPVLSIYLMILLSAGTLVIVLNAMLIRIHHRQTEVSDVWKNILKVCRRVSCKTLKENKISFQTSEADDDVKPPEAVYNENYVKWSDVTAELESLLFCVFCTLLIVINIAIFVNVMSNDTSD